MSRPEQNSAHEALKQATWPYHKDLDQLQILKKLMSPDLRLEDYRLVSAKMTNWYRHVEDTIFKAVQNCAPADIEHRYKLTALKADLADVDINYEQLGDYPAINISLDNGFEALGALYVMEGGTQGGKIISKNIAKCLPDLPQPRFFSVYGEQSDQRWQSFLDHLNNTAMSAKDLESLVTGARKTYDSLILWFKSDHY